MVTYLWPNCTYLHPMYNIGGHRQKQPPRHLVIPLRHCRRFDHHGRTNPFQQDLDLALFASSDSPLIESYCPCNHSTSRNQIFSIISSHESFAAEKQSYSGWSKCARPKARHHKPNLLEKFRICARLHPIT